MLDNVIFEVRDRATWFTLEKGILNAHQLGKDHLLPSVESPACRTGLKRPTTWGCGDMNPVTKTIADKALGVTLNDIQKGYLARVDLASSFGTIVMQGVDEDISKHTLVGRRRDATAYRVVLRRMWRWQR